MKKQFLEAGQIVNTHGIRGSVKIIPWCDSPNFLLDFDTFYIDNVPYKVLSSSVNKTTVLITFDGIDCIEKAIPLKNKIISIDRSNLVLPDGQHFIADLVGLRVISGDCEIGILKEVYPLPANDVYRVVGEREYMIPAVKEFIKEVDMENGLIRVELLGGMATDEN